MRRTARTAALGAALAAAGALAAVLSTQALGQVPIPTVSLPTVTVPVPTVPVPPAPAPPPVRVPVPPAPPPPAVTTPSLPTPSPPAPAPAPSGTAPAAIPSTGGSSSATATAADRRREPSGASTRQSRARVSRLKASPRRLAGKRRAVRITFRLSEAGRVVFVVHGPAPSCEVVGRFSVRGKRGTNRIPFKGRVGRKTLEPGTYRITAKPAGRPEQRQRVVVIVGEGPRERLQCSPADTGGVAASDYFGGGSLFGEPAAAAPGGTEGGETAAPAAPAGKERERDRGVLPAVREKVSKLPKAIPMPPLPGAADSPPMIVGLAALALLALSAIAILAYVIRFLRGPGTKSA